MISRNYIANLFRTQAGWLTGAFVLVAAFQVLILILVDTLDLPSMLEGVVGLLPTGVQQLFGEQFISDFSVGGIVALAYNHPIILVTFMLVAINLPVRHIAGAVEKGTLELLLSMPVSRARVARSLWAGSALFLVVLVLGCWFGTGIGLTLFPEARDLSLPTLGLVGLNLWLLAWTVASYALLFSAYATEAARASQWAAGLTLGFYFLDYAVQIWPAVDFLAPFTPFYFYDAQELMRGESTWIRDCLILLALGCVTGTAAVVRVGKRDVP